MYKSKANIIAYVMTWDGMASTYHKKILETIGILQNIKSYIQSRMLKKTLESISFEQRRGYGEGDGRGRN